MTGQVETVLLNLEESDTQIFMKLWNEIQKKPEILNIELLGVVSVDPDMCLAIYSLLLEARSNGIKIITNARTSLLDASILIWLAGSQRKCRESAFFKFHSIKSIEAANQEHLEEWGAHYWSESRITMYREALKVLNEYIETEQMWDREQGHQMLQEYGLISSPSDEAEFERLFAPTS